MRHHRIDLVVDVGANIGQYGIEMRALGYRGALVSIEPLPDAYEQLARTAAGDPRWRTINCAVGRAQGTATLHVAQNSVSSSMLPMLPSHIAAAPESRVIGNIEVSVRTLEAIVDEVRGLAARPFIKIDAQGLELTILEGAATTLADVEGVQVEMSIVPLYAGAPTMSAVIEWLERQGFWLTDIEPEFNDPQSGRLLQVNGLFFRPRQQGDESV
jgi:FkbM family methyltransferase